MRAFILLSLLWTVAATDRSWASATGESDDKIEQTAKDAVIQLAEDVFGTGKHGYQKFHCCEIFPCTTYGLPFVGCFIALKEWWAGQPQAGACIGGCLLCCGVCGIICGECYERYTVRCGLIKTVRARIEAGDSKVVRTHFRGALRRVHAVREERWESFVGKLNFVTTSRLARMLRRLPPEFKID